jgi:hypothetical protein
LIEWIYPGIFGKNSEEIGVLNFPLSKQISLGVLTTDQSNLFFCCRFQEETKAREKIFELQLE